MNVETMCDPVHDGEKQPPGFIPEIAYVPWNPFQNPPCLGKWRFLIQAPILEPQ
ncbi:hypothetical protein BMNI_I1643 [Brucella melitensis NI]|nr:hypothetical protein BMNI_I1643 [Brucella melitensis NI]EEW86258.1 predicted protein [Brucella melitensis bv. 1 str. 16M]EEZ12483.1 predicted protein [Brucella melitensis bv. 3 str. Ether]